MTYRFYSPVGEACRVAIVGEFDGKFLKLAAARCSRKDHFNRKIGRNIAEGRLHANKLCRIIMLDSCDVQTFLKYAKPASQQVCQTKQPFFPGATPANRGSISRIDEFNINGPAIS
jgi:hypothetical protein